MSNPTENQSIMCPHGVNTLAAHCCLCADPAFHAAKQPLSTTQFGCVALNGHPIESPELTVLKEIRDELRKLNADMYRCGHGIAGFCPCCLRDQLR